MNVSKTKVMKIAQWKIRTALKSMVRISKHEKIYISQFNIYGQPHFILIL